MKKYKMFLMCFLAEFIDLGFGIPSPSCGLGLSYFCIRCVKKVKQEEECRININEQSLKLGFRRSFAN